MAPYFVISLCDILCELPEPHGARGDVSAGNLTTACGDHLSGMVGYGFVQLCGTV
jgi:hypothetical protein